MDAMTLRAWWARKQALDGTLQGRSPAEILERTGWARSVGGVGPYITLFSRAGISREAADAAVAKLQIHELPSARGCTYVVPRSDFALALKVGEGFGHESDMKVAKKIGVTDAEIDKLAGAIVKALGKDPLGTEDLREATGGAARSLGAEGKKKGLTTTLPLALGKLQAEGEIRRVPVDGRIDQQRYRYALWRPNPLAKLKVSLEEAYTELARRFFRWIGPATSRSSGFPGWRQGHERPSRPLSLVEAPAPGASPPARRARRLVFRAPEARIDFLASVDGLVLSGATFLR